MADAVGNSLSLVITIAKQFVFVATGYVLMSFLSRTFRLSGLKGNVFSLLTVLEIILLLVCIFFPEGTTGRQGKMLPFHPNLFEGAIHAGLPVQPFKYYR